MNPFASQMTAVPETFPPRMEEFEIEALKLLLRRGDDPVDVLEWGSGGSTILFPRFLPHGSSWTSIEHAPPWYRRVTEEVTRQGLEGVSVRLVTPDLPWEPHQEGDFPQFRSYVLSPARSGKRFDLVLVDGRARRECMAVGWDLLTDDGVMVLHDAARPEYQGAIPSNCTWMRLTGVEPNRFGEIPAILFMARHQHTLSAVVATIRRYRWDVRLEGNVIPPPSRRRILFVNTTYTGYLADCYRSTPGLGDEPYWKQKRVILEGCFGDSDFYSAQFASQGWESDDIVVNAPLLQRRWGVEQGIDPNSPEEVMFSQIRAFSPDVLYLQDLSLATPSIIGRVRPSVSLIAGQIASPLPPGSDPTLLDLIFTSFPHYVDRFRSMGITTWYQPLAFEPRLLQRLGRQNRAIPVSFVGGISPLHGSGLEKLTKIAAGVPVEVWGYGAGHLPPGSPLASRHHGEAWGLDMFRILLGSRITLNRHIDAAEGFSNNMRLFEATGCGALLVTDHGWNLSDLFEIGSEVIAYRTPEEGVELVRYYLDHPDEAAAIAERGRRRTLKEHTYRVRMAKTAEILERHLRALTAGERYPLPRSVSTGHRPLSSDADLTRLAQGWKDPSIPARQRGLVQRELEAMYRGVVPPHFQALATLLEPVVDDGTTILEIGCASGYYYEILQYLLGRNFSYTGVDYSEAMTKMAREFYPAATFFTADGKALFFADRQFDVVVSSCVILHCPDYPAHLGETARVCRRWLVLHRTPVCRTGPTRSVVKEAYGVETVELTFDERQLLALLEPEGFRPVRLVEIDADPAGDRYTVSYLLERIPPHVDRS